MKPLASWGRHPYHPQTSSWIQWADEAPKVIGAIQKGEKKSSLPFGCGRSYGDSCLAASNHVVVIQKLNRILFADWAAGRIRAEAGLTLDELIRVAMPHGWFLPVSPGTKFVTLGGAVANDVHGKNHHVMGTFGRHVQHLTLYRSDEGYIDCSPSIRPDLFAATVGGLGLTGIVLTVDIQLKPIVSSGIDQRSIKFGSLDEFFDLSNKHDSEHEYTVAWIDCLATGKQTGRGHYIAGNHASEGPLQVTPPKNLKMPIDPPFSLVNSATLKVFNQLYYQRQISKEVTRRIEYDSFFYPLDGLLHWNRMYGKAGFQQYQCVIPQPNGREIIQEIIRQIAKSATGSFLAVLKQCGSIASPGLISFPMPGISLALDFPQRDELNKRLFASLDALVHDAGGRLYPAKDAHMSARHFKQAYPEWEKVEALRDPCLLSHFWKRVIQ